MKTVITLILVLFTAVAFGQEEKKVKTTVAPINSTAITINKTIKTKNQVTIIYKDKNYLVKKALKFERKKIETKMV